jgi:hypothetical protein
MSQVLGVDIGYNYEYVASLWLCNKKFRIINIFSSAVCWCLWKLRNHLCFQDGVWISMRMFWQRLVPMLKGWKILVSAEKLNGFDAVITKVEKLAWQPEQICWSCPDLVADGVSLKNAGENVPFKPP